jgi:hypothetical protein
MFSQSAESWLCDNYFCDIRYFADVVDGDSMIWDASIVMSPTPSEREQNFQVRFPRFVAGRWQATGLRKSDLIDLISRASVGQVEIRGHALKLSAPYNYYSEILRRSRQLPGLHLQIVGPLGARSVTTDLISFDSFLRRATPPFDGLDDLVDHLGLIAPEMASRPPSLTLRVDPPVHFNMSRSVLSDDLLTIVLHAHPEFNIDRVGLALRVGPGHNIDARLQIADQIDWLAIDAGWREGVGKINVKHADSALLMLMIDDVTVCREWFSNPTRARNVRLLAIQHFDKELRMIKEAIFESSDPRRFENGVAALLFLLGFSPCVQIETDSPDLIVSTPKGRLAIIECTTRISDFQGKIGHLVGRRGSLSKALAASGHAAEITAVLICRLPRNEIATHADELKRYNAILLTREDLLNWIDKTRLPFDPEQVIDAAVESLSREPMFGGK